jgi:hypothetical protein
VTRTPPAHLLDAQANRLTRTPWRELARIMLEHEQRERRGGTSQPDGYPTSTTGGGRGGAELTSVEAAVAVRLEATMPDPHQLHTWGMTRAWAQMLDALDALLAHRAALAAGDAVTVTADDWCDNHLRAGYCEPRSDRYAGLCRACGDYRANYGHLPGKTAIVHKHQHGTFPPEVDRRRSAAKVG